jgi:hypothetical protein
MSAHSTAVGPTRNGARDLIDNHLPPCCRADRRI